MGKKDLLVYTKMYDLVLWLYPAVEKFPKVARFTLAARIETTALTVLAGIIQANAEISKTATLARVSVELEKLRTLWS